MPYKPEFIEEGDYMNNILTVALRLKIGEEYLLYNPKEEPLTKPIDVTLVSDTAHPVFVIVADSSGRRLRVTREHLFNRGNTLGRNMVS